MASTRGRQVVVPLTNKSGGSVAAGDVVVIDSTNDGSFTTTTSGRAETQIGVAQETIANNATGRVCIAGYVGLVNVPASVTRGHYIETHTVAKQATGNSTRRSGSFGIFTTGGTTPTAVIWGVADATPAAGAASNLQYQTITRRNIGSNLTTTSSTHAPMDTTNLAITKTTGARVVMLVLTGRCSHSSGSGTISFSFEVDGTNLLNSTSDNGLVHSAVIAASASNTMLCVAFVTVTAASHTFKPTWRTSGATATAHQSAATDDLRFSAVELYAA